MDSGADIQRALAAKFRGGEATKRSVEEVAARIEALVSALGDLPPGSTLDDVRPIVALHFAAAFDAWLGRLLSEVGHEVAGLYWSYLEDMAKARGHRVGVEDFEHKAPQAARVLALQERDGKSREQAASDMGISPKTLDQHLRNAVEAMGFTGGVSELRYVYRAAAGLPLKP